LGEYGADLVPLKYANLIKKADSIFKIGNFYLGPIITANWAVLMNHSPTPNVQSLIGTINGKPGVYFYACKEINPGESLLYDYGQDWLEGKNVEMIDLSNKNFFCV
jgi:hypothetical protein